MTEILLPSSPSSIPSTPSSAPSHPHPDDDDDDDAGQNPISISRVNDQAGGGGGETDRGDGGRGYQHLSLLALLATIFRKPFTVACRAGVEDFSGMDIGSPTDVRHVAHVTFDRFNGFRGLPLELEPDVPRRAPSASATVFGVSTDSMQLSFDSRGNSIPTILLLMQRCLYDRGGLQAEGIFRIAAGNSQEEYVRDQLNRGVVPEDIDVHCLAGLIKAWFRELPTGVLDSLSFDQVIQCKSEEDYVAVMSHLPSADAALLDWVINLMADVVQQERENKMNAHNMAVVFAPNMTQVSDPETALNHSVKVMNFLSSIIMTTIRERERSSVTAPNNISPSPSLLCPKDTSREIQETKPERHTRKSCQSNKLLNPASESPRREVCSSKKEKLPSSSQNGSEIGKQFGVKVMENDAGKSLGKKILTTSEKLPSSQNSQSAVKVMGDDAGKSLGKNSSNSVNFKNSSQDKFPSNKNGSEIGKQPGVKVMENDSGKSLGKKISTTTEKLPSSQNSQSTVKVKEDDAGKSLGKNSSNSVNFNNSSQDKFPSNKNGSEIGKQPGVEVMENDSGKSLGKKISTTSEKLPSSQNSQSAVKVMGDDVGKSLIKNSSNSVNFKNSSQDKFPSNKNGSEIGKQPGVEVMENYAGKSLGKKIVTTTEKLPSSQSSESTFKVKEDDAGKSLGKNSSNSVNFKNSSQDKFPSNKNGSEIGKHPGVKVVENDAGKSLGKKISTTTEMLPSSQSSESTVKVKEDDAGKSLGNISSNSVNFKNSSQEKFPSSQNSQSTVKVKEDDAGKSLGNKSSNSVSYKNSSQEKLPSSQNSQSAVKAKEDDAGKSLGNISSNSVNFKNSSQDKFPCSSQNSQPTVPNSRNGAEHGKQPGVQLMKDNAGKSPGNKTSYSANSESSCQEKLPSSQNRNGTENGKQPGVKVMEDDAGMSLGKKSLNSVNIKNSIQEKLPSSQTTPSNVKNCENGPEIGKQHGVKLTADADPNFGDKSLYCMNTMSGRITEAWR